MYSLFYFKFGMQIIFFNLSVYISFENKVLKNV